MNDVEWNFDASKFEIDIFPMGSMGPCSKILFKILVEKLGFEKKEMTSIIMNGYNNEPYENESKVCNFEKHSYCLNKR